MPEVDSHPSAAVVDAHRSIDTDIERLSERIGSTELFAITHDFTRLVPIFDGDPIDVTIEMLRGFADGCAVDGPHGILVPYLDAESPVLVARQQNGDSSDDRSPGIGELFGLMQVRYERLEQLRRKQSMTAAGQIQWDELSIRALKVGDLRAAATLAPAYAVAGDLFDLALHPDGSLAVVSLDAMGHGVTAALSAVLALSAIRTRRREGASVEDQMMAADEAVDNEYGGDRFVTGVALAISNDRIDLVNAGHEPIRRYGPAGRQHLTIDAQPPLGVEGRTAYRSRTLPGLEAGEVMAVLSDGVNVESGRAGVSFGDENIDATVTTAGDAAPLAVAYELARSVIAHSRGELQDDVTALFIKASR